MKNKIIISSNKIPAAIGPYSPALKVGNLIFISGQVPINPKTGKIVGGDIETQTKRILENLRAIMDFYSISLRNIAKTIIFLKDMNNFSKINKIYAQYFEEKIPPCSCIEVSRLPREVDVEIEAIAFCS